jgi:hypothetical protein
MIIDYNLFSFFNNIETFIRMKSPERGGYGYSVDSIVFSFFAAWGVKMPRNR